MPASSSAESEAAHDLTLKQRLVAWWEGYDLSAPGRRGSDGGDAGAAGGAAPTPAPGQGKHLNRRGKPLWTADRVQVTEKIWGDGFSTPGAADFIPTVVKPFGLNPAMSVLDIGAGLGGATRTMAQQFGAWVTGVEQNPVLAEAGMARSTKAGLARQAPIQLMDLETFRWPKRVDAIFSKDTLYTVRNKDGLIDAMEAALKPRGQMLFTDYVLESAKDRSREVEAWHQHEPVEPNVWTVEQTVSALQQRNLDIRIAEDNTELHRATVLAAIQALVNHLETVSMDRETKLAVMEEVELWARRIAALERGLKMYRFYAMKPAELS